MRMGTLVEGGLLPERQPHELSRHLHVHEPRRLRGRPAGELHPPRSAIRWSSTRTGRPGFYVQDDWRARKNLTLSAGVRQEFQTHLDDRWNLAPRGGLTWSPFKNGKTTVRAGGGIFYDWLDAETLRADAARRRRAPAGPGDRQPRLSGSVRRRRVAGGPAGQQVRARRRPRHAEARARAGRGDAADLADVRRERELQPHERLGPVPRPQRQRAAERRRGPIRRSATSRRSNRRRDCESDSINVGLNFNLPARRTFLFANYAWNRQRNDADGAFSLPADSYDLAAEWGRAAGVPRHIASAVLNTTLMKSLRLGVSTAARGGRALQRHHRARRQRRHRVQRSPGRRGAQQRHQRRACGTWPARLTYAFGFGQRPPSAGGPAAADDHDPRRRRRRRSARRARRRRRGEQADPLELFVAASNLFNNVNPIGYSGVMTSPFFGQPTAAGPARKIDVGMKIGF